MIWPIARRKPIELSTADAQRLAAIRSIKPIDRRAALENLRWVVVDVETGGLDPKRDPLLSIGAVEVRHGQIDLGRSFEVQLMQHAVTAHENILLHGLTDSQQLSGRSPAQALLAFAEFVAGSACIGFHAGFDRDALNTAFEREFAWTPRFTWLDAAVIARLLLPQHASHCRNLDDWLEALHITNFARHSAVADAVATAHLWLMLLQTAKRQRLSTLHALAKLADSRRWLEA